LYGNKKIAFRNASGIRANARTLKK